jgi:hypothetical protein
MKSPKCSETGTPKKLQQVLRPSSGDQKIRQSQKSIRAM